MDDSQRSGTADRKTEPCTIPSGDKPTRVIFAEDDEAMRQLVTASLSRKGFDVVECSNGAELVELIERHIEGRAHPAIDVIVSDVQMPGRTGLECLRGLRRFDKKFPFIIITAFGDMATYEDAFRSGATAVFDKPFDLEALVQAIRRAASMMERAR